MYCGQPKLCGYCGRDHRDLYDGPMSSDGTDPTALDGGPPRPLMDNCGTPLCWKPLPSAKLGVTPAGQASFPGLGLHDSQP